MAEGRQRADWSWASLIACMIANANRDTKKKPSPFRPDDFNAWPRRRETIPKGSIEDLKVFVKD